MNSLQLSGFYIFLDIECDLLQIKFFHKVGALPTPVTDAEKLVCRVLEVERPTFSQLHEKSLIDANNIFLEKHRESLMHRAAVAELMYVLEPNKKAEAVKLIEDSVNDLVSLDGDRGADSTWKLKDCISLHKLLETTFNDHDAALRWKARCAEYFPFSTYFEGIRSSVATHQTQKTPENGVVILNSGENCALPSPNGRLDKLDKLKDLHI